MQDTSAFVYGFMSLCDKISNGVFVAIIQGIHRYKYYIILGLPYHFNLSLFSWACEDDLNECHSFYGKVLVYGIGIPFIVVIVTSLLAPNSPNSQMLARKEPPAYGSFEQGSAAVDLVC